MNFFFYGTLKTNESRGTLTLPYEACERQQTTFTDNMLVAEQRSRKRGRSFPIILLGEGPRTTVYGELVTIRPEHIVTVCTMLSKIEGYDPFQHGNVYEPVLIDDLGAHMFCCVNPAVKTMFDFKQYGSYDFTE